MAKDKTMSTNAPKSPSDLMAKIGIAPSQVQKNDKVAKTTEINTKADKLKVDLKESTHKVNTNLGKNVSFKTIKRDGYLKDNDGKFILDENDKKTPRYIETRVQGHFVIDELEDGFYKVTRGVHYTEHYLCSEFIELD